MIEEWKDFDPDYSVSNKGRIYSKLREVKCNKGKTITGGIFLKPIIDKKGYCCVTIHRKRLKVHRIVANAFLSNESCLPQVNHKDGDKTNNCVENLEWCDNSYNQIHAYKLGLNKVTGKAGKPKRKVDQIDIQTDRVLNTYSSIADAKRALGRNGGSNISKCCAGNGRRIAYGYKWRYAENEISSPTLFDFLDSEE